VLVKVLIRRRRRRMKTREIIDYPRTRGKERVKGIEAVSNPIEASLTSLIGLLRLACYFIVMLEVAAL